MRYSELANTLVKAISQGHYGVGDQLPNEIELAVHHGVSRTTVRAALDIVEKLGLVTRRRRAGTVVSAIAPRTDYTKSIHSVEDLIHYASHTARAVQGKNSLVVADDALAAALECKLGTKWLRIRMLRTEKDAAETPLCWNDAYLDPVIGKKIAAQVPDGSGLLCHLIEKKTGIAVHDIKQTIGATTIKGEMARRLQVAPDTPGLEITRLYVDGAGKTYLVTINTYPADKFRFTFWLHRASSRA